MIFLTQLLPSSTYRSANSADDLQLDHRLTGASSDRTCWVACIRVRHERRLRTYERDITSDDLLGRECKMANRQDWARNLPKLRI
jgi:hypothetical protein